MVGPKRWNLLPGSVSCFINVAWFKLKTHLFQLFQLPKLTILLIINDNIIYHKVSQHPPGIAIAQAHLAPPQHAP